MLPKREIKEVSHGLIARKKFLDGAKTIFEAVSETYGPAGNNVLLRMPFGDPVLTRDGVTVARRISSSNMGLKDQAEDDAARVLYQASEKTNKTAGDGTTATIVLAYNLLKLAHQQVAAGSNAMVLKRQLDADSRMVIEYIKSKSTKPTEAQLHEVATVSSGDPNIGNLVADMFQQIGVDSGVSIKEHDYPTLHVEQINGYLLDKGCVYLQREVSLENMPVFVTNKRIAASADILPLIQYVSQSDDKRVLIVGDVSGDAFNVLYANTVNQQFPFEAVLVPPMAYSQDGIAFAEDLATYVGAKVFSEVDNMKSVNSAYFGVATNVVVDTDHAVIFGGNGDADAITSRAAEIKIKLDDVTDAHEKDSLEKRYSKLVGKVAVIHVGSATATEREELVARVEDAKEAVKAATVDGIVPGGATTLARASVLEIGTVFRDALRDTFKKLFDNAGEPADYRLEQVLQSDFGHGFNLRDITQQPIKLSDAGIWDATRSVCQIVENATSAAGALLTANAHVGIVEHEEVAEKQTS